MFNKKIKFLSLLLAFSAQFLMVPLASAQTIPIKVNATDTVAGYASLLTAPLVTPGKEVVFVVEKPDGAILRIPAEADLSGVARADLYGHQTKMAGVYKVAFYYSGTTQASPQNTFAVFPDEVSETQSMVSSTSQMVQANGKDQTFITVTLFDAYRNPIQDHQVHLVSSDSNVKVEPIKGGVSDEEGRASFKVSSSYAGVSIFTPIDVSTNVILSDREEVIFHAPTRSNREVGGSYLSFSSLMADVGQGENVLPGPVDHFEVQGLPSSVKVDTDQTFTIVAKDQNDNVAKNYTGTILISIPNDDNAVLPFNGEYTFKESDQGQFTFNLALRFTQTGNQVIQVLDKDNWTIKGEFEVNVTSGQAVNVPTGDSLSIKSPVDGSVFGSGSLVITGQGDPNINLKVFGDDVKIADTQTDTDGFFTHQVTGLSGGSHTFYVMSEQGQVSDAVTITVDTLPPLLSSFTVTPDGIVSPGTGVNVAVVSEPDLSEVKVRMQGVEKLLLPSQGQPGTYTGVLTAPAQAGNYPLDLIMIDDLGNKTELLGQKTIQVQESTMTLPGQVQNLEGIASDNSIMLTWDALVGHLDGIASYNIYYGTNFNNLDQVAQTVGADTSLRLNNLQPATQYFFAVTAVDSKGGESLRKSAVIAVSTAGGPNALPSEMDPLDGFLSDESVIEVDDFTDFDLFPSANSQNTVSEAGGMPPASLYNNPLMGTPNSGIMTLVWQPFPGVNAAGYKVYFGLQSQQYDDYVLVPASQTTAVVQDLINNVPYYFAVVALDANGREISPLSAEFAGVPSGSAFHSASGDQVLPSNPTYVSPLSNFKLSKVPANEEVGSSAVWVCLVSVLFAGLFYGYKRHLLSTRFSKK